jgi:hypothetical protein
MRLRLLIAASLLIACAVVPGAAEAATAGLAYQRTFPALAANRYDPTTPPTDIYVLRVADPDGAADALEVDADGRLRDTAAPLTPRAGCAAGADGWVTCTPPPLASGHATQVQLAIDTGAGDDRVTVSDRGPTATLDLGPGDDHVVVTGGAWTVRGGDGADAIEVSAAYPTTTWDGGPGPDRASGPGVGVSYAGRAAGVHVTPDDVADDGEPGEGDDVGTDVGAITGGDGPDLLQAAAGVVEGGPGDDTLLGAPGTQRPPRLRGGDGDDTVLGGPGDEDLDGGDGADRLDGGAGNDLLDPGPGADRAAGGDGDDRVIYLTDQAPDVYDGGPGRDRFDARHLAGTIDVSLDGVADDGPAGEHDRVGPDWEWVTVTSGRLVGTDGPDELRVEGPGGADGRGGADVLSGFGTLTGGPGRDVITTGVDRRADRAHPLVTVDARDGAGGDRVFCAARVVRVRRDAGDRTVGCAGHPEVTLAPSAPGPLALRDGAPVSLALRCFGGQTCRGRLWLRTGRAGARPVGTRTLAVSPSVQRVAVPVQRRGAGACGTARATVRLRDDAGHRYVQDVKLGPCTWTR